MTILVFLLPMILLFVLSFWLAWQGSFWWRKGVVGPYGWPLVGNMLQFALGLRSYGDVYSRMYNENPTLSYVGIYRLFNEPAILVQDQQLLQELLIGENFEHCADNAIYVDVKRDLLAAQNPFIACGEKWRKRRGELIPLFTPLRLRQTLPHITAACQQLHKFVAHQLNNCDRFETKELATRYTLQVIASAVFGLDSQSLNLNASSGNSEWMALLGPLFQPGCWSLTDTIALLHSPRLVWLLGHRYVPLNVQKWIRRQVAGRSDGNTLLNCLKDKHDCDIEGHSTTLLLEGYETSATLLAFALYELALNPSIQRQLQEEVDEVARYNGGRLLEPEALDALQYTEATLFETLRLHPAMPALLKRCTKSFVLPSQCKEKGENDARLRVPKDMVLVVPVQAIHLDPMLYQMPLSFQPERFMQKSQSGCRFLGFGAGPRMCPGIRFGLAQTKAALATLLQDYNVQLSDKSQPVEKSNVTFLTASKGGIWLRFNCRRAK
ncbi:probable cytochrome P450 308a1 [Drosophila innubila]|uniref:probable cytochrome P450 308a1 n=1 Tax=Drosophila innubila TaxID=198719 RepID=UPI00148BA6A9|nr:probable cytochrome P450 308a1 [Drosophila innubila]